MNAVVLLSGGLDSATALAVAVNRCDEVHALSFDYGQRHRVELSAAEDVAWAGGVVEHYVADMRGLGRLGGSSLTGSGEVSKEGGGDGIPSTYVPARNLNMLSFAVGYAEVNSLDAIYVGVNAVDYSGYPDCRPDFIRAFETVANLATKRGVEGNPVEVKAPLIEMTKTEIIRRGTELGVDYSLTLSCYDPDRMGHACGGCDSCRIRRKGFEDAGIEDPTRYQREASWR